MAVTSNPVSRPRASVKLAVLFLAIALIGANSWYLANAEGSVQSEKLAESTLRVWPGKPVAHSQSQPQPVTEERGAVKHYPVQARLQETPGG
ncbi:MAG: hypothetical protein AB8B93_02865 [Pseudomonadales bacterium]